jgi:membrane protein implicated in regulation of membrane protease activity
MANTGKRGLMMNQTKLTSLIEALLNTAIGFAVSFAGWPIAAALTGIQYTTGQHWVVVGFFTVLSVARGYLIRRFFNSGLHLVASRTARKLSQ